MISRLRGASTPARGSMRARRRAASLSDGCGSTHARVARQEWWLVLASAVVLALLSLASNVTTTSQLSGTADGLLTARWTVSKVLNAGVVWAGLPVLAGWLVRRPVHAVLAGVASSITALVVHYGVGRAVDVFASTIWAENASWFLIATLAGAPLGVVGALARRRRSPWGLLARLTVPTGALIEPFVLGMFTAPDRLPWPDQVSGVLSELVLVTAGAAGVVAVVI